MLLVSNALAALSVYKTSVSPHFSPHLETLSFCLNAPVVKHIIYVIKKMKYKKESNGKIAFSCAVAAFRFYHFSATPPGAQMAESFSKCGLGLFYNVVHLLMELYQREREREREREIPDAFARCL